MSTTTTSQKHMFFVYAPDKTTEGTFELRKSVHAEHIARMGGFVKEGIVLGGGAMTTLETATLPPEDKFMIGSAMIFMAESEKALKDILKEDIYWKAGVWDLEKMVITGLYRGNH